MTAQQGSFYTVQSGDRLWKLSRQAYGDQWVWKRIQDANPQLNGRPTAEDGSPLIYPEETLFIPVYDKAEIDSFAGEQSVLFRLVIGDTPIPVTEAEFLSTIDTGTDYCSCVVLPELLPQNVQELLKPFRYPTAKIYLKGQLKLTGKVYSVSPSFTTKGFTKTLKIFSNTADLIDSCCTPPYSQNGATLKQRAETLCKPFGLVPSFPDGDGGKFDRITATKTENRFEHLLKLARKKKYLISCTPTGNPLFFRPGEQTEPVDTLDESKLGPVESWSGNFDGRERFSHYRVSGKSVKKVSPNATVTDPAVPCFRIHCSGDASADSGDVENSADWQRSKALADALSLSLTVDSWKTKKGKLWQPNTYVTVKSKSLDIPNGVNLLIRRVTYKLETDKETAVIDCVPREVFTGEPVPDIFA